MVVWCACEGRSEKRVIGCDSGGGGGYWNEGHGRKDCARYLGSLSNVS